MRCPYIDQGWMENIPLYAIVFYLKNDCLWLRVNVLMCESINELTHLRINEFLYPYLAFRNTNTIEVDIIHWRLQQRGTLKNWEFEEMKVERWKLAAPLG